MSESIGLDCTNESYIQNKNVKYDDFGLRSPILQNKTNGNSFTASIS